MVGLEVHLKPKFRQPRVEGPANALTPPRQFMFHVHGSTSGHAHLRILVTNFHSNHWEVMRSVSQLDDLRDSIGIGRSWSEFIGYLVASLKSQDIKLVLDDE
ncbi:hypothetical protein ACFX13_015711 [Malus domestica]